MSFRLTLNQKSIRAAQNYFDSQPECSKEILMKGIMSLSAPARYALSIAIDYESTPSSIETFLLFSQPEREYRLKLAFARSIRDDPYKYGSLNNAIEEIRAASLIAPSEDNLGKIKKKEFILDPDNLTSNQRKLVALFSQVPETELTRSNIESFEQFITDAVEKNPKIVARYWQAIASELFVTSSLVTKIRFCSSIQTTGNIELTYGEVEQFRKCTGIAFEDSDERTIRSFVTSFIEKRLNLGRAGSMDDEKYSDPVYNSLKDSLSEDIANDAIIYLEYALMLDFLGIKFTALTSHINLQFFHTETATKRALPTDNQDCAASIRLTIDNKKILLDAVFDGVGQTMDAGIASLAAKNTFITASMSGWIVEKEDLYFLMILMDLAVIAEQMHYKKYAQNILENNMATTATIMMQKGDDVYVTYQGDSPAKIIRNGIDILNFKPHNIGTINNMDMNHPNAKKIPHVLKKLTSTLGSHSPHIGLNFYPEIPPKFILGEKLLVDDIIVLHTDGMNQVCIHEFEQAYSKNQLNLFELAKTRTLERGMHADLELPCGCTIEVAGCDDKTYILRSAKEGF